MVSTIRSGMTSVRSTIATIDRSLGEASAAVADTGDFLGGSLPESIDAVQGVLPTIESIAGSIDRALRVLERVPFGPSYDPVQPFNQAIADLSAAIEPLPDQLRTLNGDLQRVGGSAQAVREQMAGLTGDLDRLDVQLGGVAALLDRYAGTASQAERLALGIARRPRRQRSLGRPGADSVRYRVRAGPTGPALAGLVPRGRLAIERAAGRDDL